MRSRHTSFCLTLSLLLAVASAIHAQTFNSIPAIAFDTGGPVLRAHAEALKPFTVSGERGVILGQQDGTLEAWVLPVKLLSHLTIEARIQGYSVPIDVNQQAAEIEVRPDRTVITYSHIGFTVRQIMFSPDEAEKGTGPLVLFEFDCLHPTDFTLRFTPELRWMWPERNEGVPNAEWVARGVDMKEPPGETGGFYVLHSDYPDLAGAVTIPGAQPGILAPYQERPQVHPVELILHIDPARDRGRLFPLLMAVGTNPTAATTSTLGATLAKLNQEIPASYRAHEERYKALLANSVSIETPDKTLNEAFQWAVVSIEQLKAHVPVAHAATGNAGPEETALVAGYYASGDSARPGFGWFFGRDALYTLYAVNGYGDFALTRSELEFLMNRQRADGKIMHEYSQIAASIDWQAFPYMYAAADSTPLFLLAMEDYVRASGDTAFLTAHRDAIEKAWAFETDPAHDADHDGIYDNSQGTGWVESWPGGMPHQEIYLALLDQQASAAMAKIEALLKDSEKATAAQHRADSIAKTIESEYYDAEKSCYAFSRNADGSQDRTRTVYPSLAWWSSDTTSGKSILAHPEGCLRQLASHTLNTDWGLRDVSNEEKIYDGMSYHQGSVWPLFTGWAALAEYRANQPLAGYQMLMENANLTRAQDLGAVTELLSGDFNVPFGRSTSHQLWSSAMVITPTLRGLFGISIDAQTKTITVNPRLPASWDRAEIRDLGTPSGPMNLSFSRSGETLEVCPYLGLDEAWHLRSDSRGATLGTLVNDNSSAKVGVVPCKGLRIPVHPMEIEPPAVEPSLVGTRTEATRVLSEEWGTNRVALTFEGQGDSRALVGIHCRRGIDEVRIDSPQNKGREADGGARLAAQLSDPRVRHSPDPLKVDSAKGTLLMWLDFPPGEGWQTITVTLTW
ncbi:MAG: amylo-alpha-1,6-glucosidase [Terracidiphilus sp.]